MTRNKTSLIRWARKQVGNFLTVLDSGHVKMFQAVIYTSVMIAGAYMIWYGSGPSVIEQELSDDMHYVWIWFCTFGPASAALGDILVRNGERSFSAGLGGGRRIYWGWYFQFGGDAVVSMVFLTYVVASFQAAWLQRGIFAAFVMAALMLCAILLTVRDFRSVRGIERLRNV
jgi:hypothetical protein